MSRRSGHRFVDKDMRKYMNLEVVPIPQERDVLQQNRGVVMQSFMRKLHGAGFIRRRFRL
jgi:hypothetical protein